MSVWANPFKIGQDGDRAQVLAQFRKWFPSRKAAREVGLLKGKVLLCHCRADQECHADVLLELAGEEDRLSDPPGVTTIPYKDTEDYVKGNKAELSIPTDFIDDGLMVRTRDHFLGDDSVVTQGVEDTRPGDDSVVTRGVEVTKEAPRAAQVG